MGEDPKQEDTVVQAPSDPPLNGNVQGAGLAVADETATVEPEEPPSQDSEVAPEEASQPTEAEETAPLIAVDTTVSLEQIESRQKEKQELYERLLRKQAEFDNFRKRTEREKTESFDFAVANFIQGLLPAIDGLERGLSVTEGETVESYKKGIELILKQLRDLLASAGVQPIRAMGKMFDPNFHQAVLREESSVLPENEIIEEMQRGYTFKDRLLRPSMVKVAVAPAVAAEPEAAEPEASPAAVKNESETVE